jgi:hypothetical protein
LKAPSPVILPTSTTLTVSMTPVGSGLSTPAPQVLPIPSTPSPVVSVAFKNIAWGSYKISAVAADSSGNPQSAQVATLEVSGDSQNATLDLLPVGFSITTVTSNGQYLASIMAPDEVQMYSIPSDMLGDGSAVPLGYYQIQFTPSSTLILVASDADGNILYEGMWDGTILTTFGGTSTVNSSSGTADIYIGPCPSTGATTLIFANGSMTNSVGAQFFNAGW